MTHTERELEGGVLWLGRLIVVSSHANKHHGHEAGGRVGLVAHAS